MRTFFLIVLALITGALAGREFWRYWGGQEEKADPVEVIVTQMRTHAVIEHERQVAIWYRACPSVWGKSPQIFMAWPARLTYQIELGDIEVSRQGSVIHVRTSAIHAVDPSVPTDHMDHMATTSMLTFANEQELVNQEIAKATPVARYLTTYYLAHDPSLPQDFREELQSLVEHFTASLGVPITRVEVEIPPVQISNWPQLPRIELCPGSLASVNGLAFAKFASNALIPIGFQIPPRHPPTIQRASSSSRSLNSVSSPASASVMPISATAVQGEARGAASATQ